MLLAKLISDCRTRLDDVAEPFLWSDDDLTDYANDAENEACERALLLEEDSLAHVVSGVTIAQTAGVATAHKVAHGFLDGQRVRLAGANQAGYNLELPVHVIGADDFTYPVNSVTVTPATGTITATLVAGTITNITGLANIGTYALDPRIIQIRAAMWDAQQLTGIARETLDNPKPDYFTNGTWGAFSSYFSDWLNGRRDWSTLTGSPRYFIDPQEKYFTLVRIPTEAADIHLSVYRRPLAPMLLADADTISPEIQGSLHVKLIAWMEYRAYSRRDADAHAPDLADKKEAEFTASFGIRPDANVRRQQRARRSNAVRMNPSW